MPAPTRLFAATAVLLGAVVPAVAPPALAGPPEPAARCHGRAATLVGTPGPDVIRGTTGKDVIVAGPGADVIHGRGGDDIVCGGGGADLILAGVGNDQAYGQAGDDVLAGGWGHNVLSGGSHRQASPGGIPRGDAVTYAAAADAVHVDLGAGRGWSSRTFDTLASIESAQGSRFDDVIAGGARSGWFLGGGGDDKVTAGDHAAVEDGGPGDDNLLGSVEDDRLRGGRGQDFLAARSGDDHYDGGPGDDAGVDPLGNDVVRDLAGTDDYSVGQSVSADDDDEVRIAQGKVSTGDGDDTIVISAGRVSAGAGYDQVSVVDREGVDGDVAVSLGSDEDNLTFQRTALPSRLSVSGDGGTDAFQLDVDLGTSDVVVSMGGDGMWTAPFSGAFTGVELYWARSGVNHVTGSANDDQVTVPRGLPGQQVFGMAGNDDLDGPDGSIDGGSGDDLCYHAPTQVSCELDW